MPDTPPKPGLRREDLLEMWDCCSKLYVVLNNYLYGEKLLNALRDIETIKTNIKKCIDPEVR